MEWLAFLSSSQWALTEPFRGRAVRFFASWEAPVYLALATPLSLLAGVAFQSPPLLPLLNALVAYPVMLAGYLAEQRLRTFALMIWWATLLAVTVGVAGARWEGVFTEVVINGPQYQEQMFSWIRTGYGEESAPRRFIPTHLTHTAIFCGASILSGGLAGLYFGAVLMNFMSYYVAGLLSHATDLVTVAVMGWPIWSVLRVVSFIALGVALSEPLARWMIGEPMRWRGIGRWVALAAIGLVADVALKWWFAPLWRLALRDAVDF